MSSMPKSPASPTEENSHESSHTEIEWNAALETLLCNEAEKCQGLSWLHSHAEVEYSKHNNRLQIPIIILSTVVGAASVGSGSLFPGNAGLASISLGAVSILVSILGLINTHYAFAKRAEGHKLGSVQYGQIHRMIHIEMSLPRNQRMAPKAILRYIKDDLKRLMETLPRVPQKSIDAYKVAVMPKSPDVSHPEITNGIHKIEAYSIDAVTALTPPPTPLERVRVTVL
jgi:hypothetical protein